MAERTILRMGNAKLYEMAQPIKEFNTPALDNLISDLFETMTNNSGVGIAAPQIGVPLQVIVFGFEKSARYPHAQPVPTTILINPQVEVLNDEMNDDWEGCLSVRVARGLVPRYTHLKYSGYDPLGNFFERTVEGFHARLIQHEIDHLHGILFHMRIKNLRYFGFEEEIKNLMNSMGSKLK